MNVAKTLKHKITNHSRIFDETLDIYNDVLAFIIDVIETEFEDVYSYTSKQMLTAVERLIHETKANPHPKYGDFEKNTISFLPI